MTLKNEDVVPDSAAYPYFWDKETNTTPLKDFLTKYKPSMVQDDGTKPWLWVRRAAPAREDTNTDAATEEAIELLKEMTKRVEDIQHDESIPIRANKKKGLRSKKELREEVQREATEKLKDISIKHGFVSGKWLMFAPADKVDAIWTSIATSLVEGPLASTSAYLTKVATSPREEHPNYQHVLCLYVPDVYDQDNVTAVMKVLLRHHGANLSGVKSNLYTAIGLDSKHASGIQSTVWKNAALMRDAEMKALKDEYFAELSAAKATKSADAKEGAQDTTDAAAKPAKPKLKKKAAKNDPFVSDDEPADDKKADDAKADEKAVDGAADTMRGKPASKTPGAKKPLRKKAKAEPVFEDDDVDEDGSDAADTRKREAQAHKKAVKRSLDDEDDAEDEEARPAKSAKPRGRK